MIPSLRRVGFRTFTERLALGLVVTFVTVVLAGCTDADGDISRASPASASSAQAGGSANFVARMDALLADVNQVKDPGAVVSVPARPTVVQRQHGVQTMIIRDEDAGTWTPGKYRLVVRCAGEGVLVAHLSLGGRSNIRQLDACTAATMTDAVEVQLDQPAHNSVVVIVPAGESMAAVGYQIEKVG
ncbi:hypothetical protein SAMN04489867_2177 [Pedococcus dokdonensis]|uniref:Lipoprotein n=1 Tax=Pedococcus dokdonensis TaxID=443156 RepID=A0A1H0S243_9MICO|nr:hypothetical protein [Pedococcus dokdonensis]SDP35687.1 hypothetical protein SAMN04489867_2177 [Pedococcus dokdonensis]